MNIWKYEASWFDHGEWSQRTIVFLALSDKMAQDFINDLCKPEYRGVPYRGEYKDSLVLTQTKLLTFPYLLREY